MASRKLEVEIVGDSRSLERAFGRSSKAGSSLGKTFATLGKTVAIAGVALGAAAAIGMKKSIDAASNLTEQVNKSNVVFRQSSTEVKKWSEGLASNFGLSSRAALEAAGTYGNMLVPMGFARDKAADMSKAMVELAGDMSSFNNVPLDDTLAGIQSGLAGMSKPLRRFGVDLSAARVAQEAMIETGKKTATELTMQEKTMARYNLILKDTKDTQGDFARSAKDSVENQMRIMQASVENLEASIGKKLLPTWLALLQWVNAHMPEIQAVVESVVNGTIAVIEKLVPVVQGLITTFEMVGEKASSIWTKIADIIGINVKKTTDNLDIERRGMGDFQQEHQTMLQQMSNAAQRYWPQVQQAADSVLRWYRGTLAPAIQNVLTAVQALWARFGGAIAKIAKTDFGIVTALVKMNLGNMLSVVEFFLAVLRGDWSAAFSSLLEIPKRTFAAMVTLVRGMASNVYTAAMAVGKALIDGVKAGIEATLQSVLDRVTSVGHSIVNALKTATRTHSPSEETIYIGRMLAEGLGVGFGQRMVTVSSDAADKIRAMIDAMIQAVQNRRSTLSSAFSDLISNALAAFDAVEAAWMSKHEKIMAKQDEQRAKAARQQALADAQAQLAAAQAAAPTWTMGQAKPEGFDQAGADIVAAQKAVADAEFEIQRAKDEKLAAAERKAHEDRAGVKRKNFEDDLTALEAQAERVGMSTEQLNKRIIGIFKNYEVPFKKAAKGVGDGLILGLQEAIGEVEKAAVALKRAIMKHLDNITVRVNVDVTAHDRPDAPGFATGVKNFGGGWAMVGERGPELVRLPRGSDVIPHNQSRGALAGAGGATFNLYAPNYVGDKRDLANAMQEVVARFVRDNGGSFFPGS